MLKKAIAILIISTLALHPVVPYALEGLSLDTLIKEALEKNPGILASKKRWEASSARVPQARSPEDPVIGVRFEKTPGSPFRLSKTPSEDRMFSISQVIPWFGRLPLKGKIAFVESQMYAAELKDKQLEIINEVKNSYFDLFMNYKEIELSQQSLLFLENIAKQAEIKYSLAELSQEEVFKIHSEIARLSNDISNLKQENLAKQTKLNSLLNRPPENALGEPQLNEDLSFNKNMDTLYKLTLENQPELLTFSYAIERNKHAKDLAKKSYFPDIMAGVVARGITAGTIGPWDLMLAFTVPFWFWSKQRYEVKEAIANLEEAEAAYQAMKNKALAETKSLAAKTEIAKNKIKLYKDSLLPILEASIESSLAAFRSGKGDFMMLLDSERMLVETKMDYYKALVEYNMNLADLERQVGAALK